MSNQAVSQVKQGEMWIAVGSTHADALPQVTEHLSLDDSLLAQLIRFQTHQGLTSLTQAIHRVLLDYFGSNAIDLESHKGSSDSEPLRLLVAQLQTDQQQLFRTVTTLQQSLTVLMLQMQQPTAPVTARTPRIRPTTACTGSSLKPAVYEKGISGTDLAARLQTSSASISRRRSRANFPAWSQMQDPEHIAWQYFGSTRRFHPVTLSFSANSGTNFS